MQRGILVTDIAAPSLSEDILEGEGVDILKLSDIDGIHGYCDEAASAEICRRLAPFSTDRLHIWGSGNFHYLSYLRLKSVTDPFSLVVFDHHPDTQLPAFEGVVSCGGWVRNLLDESPSLQEVLLVGPSSELIAALPDDSRLCCICEEKFEGVNIVSLLEKKRFGAPVYISIDKDILSAEWAHTDWDHGSVDLSLLCAMLRAVMHDNTVAGIDICGNSTDGYSQINEKSDLELLYLVEQECRRGV